VKPFKIGTVFAISEKIFIMKKLIFSTLLLLLAYPVMAQAGKADILQDMEKKQPVNQNVTSTATLKSSSRLFGSKDDLTTVIMVVPSGSVVNVLDTDSIYLHIVFEDNEGWILKRHAVMDRTSANVPQVIQQPQAVQQGQPAQRQVMSRRSYLENKYGPGIASKIDAGKIWKGMSAEMVTDSWGIADKINKVTSGNILKEEWIFKNTWLYFENNLLIEWGPVRK
jgi:hypothetical protein